MQDRERIQKEIETLKLQLNFAEISALTASAEEKDNWEQRRNDLQLKLIGLEKDLEDCVVYDGNHASSIIDEETADAMLEQILAAGEPESADSVAPDLSVESADEVVINQFDGMNDENLSDALDDLLASMDENEKSEVTETKQEDASVQAMVDEILMAGEEHEYKIESKTDDSVTEKPVQVIEEKNPEPENEPEEQHLTPWQPDNDPAEDMLKSILAVTAEREKSYENEEKVLDSVQQKSEIIPSPVITPITVNEPQSREFDEQPFSEDFMQRLNAAKESGRMDAELFLQIEKIKLEVEDAYKRAQLAVFEAAQLKKDAERIKLSAESERAMFAAEMELQKGLRSQEEYIRSESDKAEKDRIAEKIAKRKAEITEIRNGLQNVKDSDSAFVLREKLFAVQLVLDDDERSSPEISYLLTKSLDDLSHALEISDLKRRLAALAAAKKPVKKLPRPKRRRRLRKKLRQSVR